MFVSFKITIPILKIILFIVHELIDQTIVNNFLFKFIVQYI